MWLLRNIFLFRNWLDLYSGSITGKLRNGLVIEMATRHDIPILWEVIGERCYGAIEGNTIVDLGGNIGTFSLLAAKENPRARVFTYEPSSSNFKLLLRNIHRNGMAGQIQANELAVAGEEGARTFHIAKHGDSGHNSFYDVGSDDDLVTVNCTTLDAIIHQTGAIDFLKIDVEGAETEILENSTLLDTHVRKIVIEGDEKVAEVLRIRGFHVEIPSRLFIVATNNFFKE